MRGIGRVGLQRQWYRYDGLPHEKPAPEGTIFSSLMTARCIIVDSFGLGTVLTIGAVVGGLVTLNWYQSRDLVRPSLYHGSDTQYSDVIMLPRRWNLILSGPNIRANTAGRNTSTGQISSPRIISPCLSISAFIDHSHSFCLSRICVIPGSWNDSSPQR